jgi:hypothetical protein
MHPKGNHKETERLDRRVVREHSCAEHYEAGHQYVDQLGCKVIGLSAWRRARVISSPEPINIGVNSAPNRSGVPDDRDKTRTLPIPGANQDRF